MYEEFLNEEDSWKGKVVQYTDLRQVITTYRQGNLCGDIFKDIHAGSNKKLFAAGRFSSKTTWMARYLHSAVAMVAFLWAGNMALDGDMQTGDFVALMGTIFKFDQQMR